MVSPPPAGLFWPPTRSAPSPPPPSERAASRTPRATCRPCQAPRTAQRVPPPRRARKPRARHLTPSAVEHTPARTLLAGLKRSRDPSPPEARREAITGTPVCTPRRRLLVELGFSPGRGLGVLPSRPLPPPPRSHKWCATSTRTERWLERGRSPRATCALLGLLWLPRDLQPSCAAPCSVQLCGRQPSNLPPPPTKNHPQYTSTAASPSY